MVPGTAGGSFEGQHLRCGSRFAGQAVPGVLAWLAGPGAEVGVDLAGGVALEAADDLWFGQAFLAAPGDVGTGRRV